MSDQKTKAILVVSFGTSYADAEKKNICRIEEAIGQAYPEYAVYRAWTSGMIRRKLKKRDGVDIDDVAFACERMAGDGVREVVVQPTHVMNGIENDLMRETALSFADRFSRMRIGDPLITSREDSLEMAEALAEEWKGLGADEQLVLMGHGTEHDANFVYAAMDYLLKDIGHENIAVGTVEAYPDLDALLRQTQRMQPRTVHLAPFMIVAGDHAQNDMAGEDPDSWKSRFEKEGYPVECHLKGLGEYEGVRRILVRHVREAK